MNSCKFSVIIPVYNVESYIEECLDSVLHQSYENFEIVLIDDGSKDKSGYICDKYKKNFPQKITIIHKENQGLISARRVGLKNALGDYICFVDSDDMVSKDWLYNIEKIISEHKPDIIQFKWEKIDLKGNFLSEDEDIFDEGIISKDVYFSKIVSTSKLNSLCKKVCKRSIFDIDNDYKEYYSLSNGEDLLQTLPLIYNAKKIYYCNRAFYYYRTNPNSITNKYIEGKYQILNILRPKVYEMMVKLGYDTQKNITDFYRMYLDVLWATLCQIFIYNKYSAKVFEEIIAYPYVIKSYPYIRKMKITRRIGLYLFFKKKWSIMRLLMKIMLRK